MRKLLIVAVVLSVLGLPFALTVSNQITNLPNASVVGEVGPNGG